MNSLPRGLQVLELTRVDVTGLRYTPSSLQALMLDVRIHDLSWLPASVHSLTLGPYAQEGVLSLPSGLELDSLSLSGEHRIDVNSLPGSLKSLDLGFVNDGEFEKLPDGLERLSAGGPGLTRIDGLPRRLRTLELRWTKVRRISRFPGTLTKLDVTGSALEGIMNLPRSLEELNISRTVFTGLPTLPARLRSLDISSSDIHSLRGGDLPPHLEKLWLSPFQLSDFRHLPASIRELHFVDDR